MAIQKNSVAARLLALLVLMLTASAFGFTSAPTTFVSRPTTATPITTCQRKNIIVLNAGPAVAEPETIKKEDVFSEEKVDQKEKVGGEAWEVRLWNDPFNKREFVARCLSTICGKSDGESFQIMMQAHRNGMGVVGRYAFEIAELYIGSLKDEGLLVDMVPVDDE